MMWLPFKRNPTKMKSKS